MDQIADKMDTSESDHLFDEIVHEVLWAPGQLGPLQRRECGDESSLCGSLH